MIATDALSPLPVVLVALLILVAMILLYKFLTRTRGMRVGKTRVGFFVERDPFTEPEVEDESDSPTAVWHREGIDP